MNAIPGVTGFGHLLLMVSDIDRSTRFYVDRLGFIPRVARPLQDGRAFTPFHHGFALIAGRAPGHRQIDHIAFAVADVRQLRDQLHAAAVPFFQDLHDGPYGLTIYVEDPDGTKVELYEAGATV
jgi:ureidoacrylate peracid hydrolase